jgi:transcriptional regulator with XRE-family HTH domain
MTKIVTSGDQFVGSRLRLRRKQCAITEGGLAALLGVTQREIRAYERGELRIGAERLAQASQALRAPISFFFSGLGPPGPQPAEIPTGLDTALPGNAALLSAYIRTANSRRRAAVLRLALHLARGQQASGGSQPAEVYGRKRRWH